MSQPTNPGRPAPPPERSGTMIEGDTGGPGRFGGPPPAAGSVRHGDRDG